MTYDRLIPVYKDPRSGQIIEPSDSPNPNESSTFRPLLVTMTSEGVVLTTISVGPRAQRLNIPNQLRLTLVNYDPTETVYLSESVSVGVGFELRSGATVTIDTNAPIYASSLSPVSVGVIYESLGS